MGDYASAQVYVLALPEPNSREPQPHADDCASRAAGECTCGEFERQDADRYPEATVLALFHEHGLSRDWDWRPDSGPDADLALDEVYGDTTGRLDLVQEVGSVLADMGCTFLMWQDPKYEYGGELWMHVPGVGTLTGTCDADANLYLTDSELDRLVDAWHERAGPDAESWAGRNLALALEAATGRPVREAFLTARRRLEEAKAREEAG